MSTEKRPDGYYWVRTERTWYVALFRKGLYEIGEHTVTDEAIDEIGPPCSRDDAKQLAKAREVLRKIRQLAETHEFVDDWVFREMIEQSGVRL